VRCWFAPHDLPIGARIRPAIDESIRLHDKLLLVLSETSVGSQWVEQEVETALSREREPEGKTVLFPIRIDGSVEHDVRLRVEVGFEKFARRVEADASLRRRAQPDLPDELMDELALAGAGVSEQEHPLELFSAGMRKTWAGSLRRRRSTSGNTLVDLLREDLDADAIGPAHLARVLARRQFPRAAHGLPPEISPGASALEENGPNKAWKGEHPRPGEGRIEHFDEAPVFVEGVFESLVHRPIVLHEALPVEGLRLFPVLGSQPHRRHSIRVARNQAVLAKDGRDDRVGADQFNRLFGLGVEDASLQDHVLGGRLEGEIRPPGALSVERVIDALQGREIALRVVVEDGVAEAG
jgi:hypothetical protein